MKTFTLQSHTKPITDLVFSPEGDLLFVASKDQRITVWRTKTAELLGSYQCNGAVKQISLDTKCRYLLAGCGDSVIYVFDVKSGKLRNEILIDTPCMGVQLGMGNNKFFVVTSNFSGKKPAISVYDIRSILKYPAGEIRGLKPEKYMEYDRPMTTAIWGKLNKYIIAGCVDGSVVMFDVVQQKVLGTSHDHKDKVNKMQRSTDGTLFVTASYDHTAKLYELDGLELKKTYQLNENVNTAAISPDRYHVVLGGGQASLTTMSNSKKTYYDTHFMHMIFEKEIGTVKGHFGPVQHLRFMPDGSGYASGGEDGFVRIVKFNQEYTKINDDPKSMVRHLFTKAMF